MNTCMDEGEKWGGGEGEKREEDGEYGRKGM